MDGRADASRSSLRELIEELVYAGVGAAALTKDRIDDLVNELAARGQMTRDEARDVVNDVTGRWRGDALRMSERAAASLAGTMRELGLVTRREWEELELRLSQLEHRIRLLETGRGKPPGSGSEPLR